LTLAAILSVLQGLTVVVAEVMDGGGGVWPQVDKAAIHSCCLYDSECQHPPGVQTQCSSNVHSVRPLISAHNGKS